MGGGGGATGTGASMSPNGLMGSRAALSINQPTGASFSDWLASVPDWAQTSEGQSVMGSLFGPPGAPPPMATPQSGGVAGTPGPAGAGNVAAGFQAGGMVPGGPLDSNPAGIQHIGTKPAPAPVVAPEPKKEDLDPNRPGFYNGIELGDKVWPPPAGQLTGQWLAENPHVGSRFGWPDAASQAGAAFEVPDHGPPGDPQNSWYHKKGDPR